MGIWICVLFIVCGFIAAAFSGAGMEFWLQLFIAWWFLEFIWSLTCDNGQSIWYNLFTTKIALWLGKISYALYLIHEIFIFYIMWINYGYNPRPDCEYGSDDVDCEELWGEWNWKRLIPMWCIPIVWAVSIPIAALLNTFFEEPLRKRLRPQKK